MEVPVEPFATHLANHSEQDALRHSQKLSRGLAVIVDSTWNMAYDLVGIRESGIGTTRDLTYSPAPLP